MSKSSGNVSDKDQTGLTVRPLSGLWKSVVLSIDFHDFCTVGAADIKNYGIVLLADSRKIK